MSARNSQSSGTDQPGAGSGRRSGPWSSDQRLLVGLSAAMVVLIVVVSVLAPQNAENDPRPTSTNPGPQGAAAVYKLFERLGRRTIRWEQPVAELSSLNAEHTTLLLAEPVYAATDQKQLAADLQQFLERGGRILATGPAGAELMPGGATQPPGVFQAGLCTTTPEGPGELAAAGPVGLVDQGGWASEAAQFRVAQRCGNDAVVVSYPVTSIADQASGTGSQSPGAASHDTGTAHPGEVVWWSSATPLTNAGLKQDTNLRLLLASVGPGRDVVFDESLHRETPSLWDAAKGLPLRWLAWQTAGLFLLLVLSFSRRRGPIRSPLTLPRSSPLEFSTSMGDLYEKAGASSAAIDAARRRLLAVLSHELGPALPGADTATAGAGRNEPGGLASSNAPVPNETFADRLRERAGGDWSQLEQHLQAALQTQQKEIAPRSALALVRALHQDGEAVQRAMAATQRFPETERFDDERTALEDERQAARGSLR